MNAISKIDYHRQATDAAGQCRELVLKTAAKIQGRRYVQVEGWQAIANSFGCVASAYAVEVVDGGIRATGQVRRIEDGLVIAEAEGFVGDDETTWRLFPQIGAKWQYPFARRSGTTTQVIEPIVGIVGGPNGSNPDTIPNEDSRSFEFDTTNLLRLNRYEGVDRVTSGSRVDYALRSGVYGDGGGSTEVLIGQSYRFYGDSAFEPGSGLY